MESEANTPKGTTEGDSSEGVPSEQAVQYAIARYSEQYNRSEKLEEKSSKMISLLTVVLGVLLGVANFHKDDLLDPDKWPHWIALACLVGSMISFATSWIFAYLVLRVKIAPVASRNTGNFDYIRDSDPDESLRQIYDCYTKTIPHMTEYADGKADHLQHSYHALAAGGIFAALTTLALFLERFL